ncbi:hypothetical protein BGZ68_010694 [Mortierella alpina]|nr:hypothetical protein BGZ68_010694 [Mortierella alpina]
MSSTARAPAPASARTRKLIVLCDGTWCGSETNTQSNIFRLAEMIGINMAQQNPNRAAPIRHSESVISACYFPGAGLGGTFLEYLFNGLTCSDIDRDCIDVYKYIVERYSQNHEIWMFGFSRGAYTARCVAGMINNCGILRRRRNNNAVATNNNDDLTEEEEVLCKEVYKIYRSRDPEDHPKAAKILRFKSHASHNVPTPVKFMGLFDTVGALGLPTLDAGIGLDFPGFYDQNVSSVVEKRLKTVDQNLKYTSAGSQAVTTISAVRGFGFCETDQTG